MWIQTNKKYLVASLLILLVVSLFASVTFAEEDVTSKVQLTKSRLMYNRATKVSYLDVSLKNISENVLIAPVKVVIDSISPSSCSWL